MSPVVVVALPAKDDYVNKISSEPVAHMTLMMLGESTDGMNVPGMLDYLTHAVNTSLPEFGLSVKKRGPLGPKQADVLFFNEWGLDHLRDFIHFLRTNELFEKFYNSVPQYDEWTAHMTLGYPETPAHSDNRDYPGINWVKFDRIALWTDNYAGTEIELPVMDDTAVGWGDDSTALAFLEHYGIKGMHWGIRRTQEELHPDHTRARALRAKSRKHGTGSLSNEELQKLITRMNLEQQYSRLVPPKPLARIAKGGAKLAADVVTGVGKKQLISLVDGQVTKNLADLFGTGSKKN